MAEEPPWHGWRREGHPALHIGMLDGRKLPSLYASESNEYVARITPLASFASAHHARIAMDLLDGLIPTRGWAGDNGAEGPQERADGP